MARSRRAVRFRARVGVKRGADACRRPGSLYFATCFAEHMPEDVDLVIIELGELGVWIAEALADDSCIQASMMFGECARLGSRFAPDGFRSRDITVQMEYELLLRGILALPNRPAIINLQTIGLVFDALSQGGDQVSQSSTFSVAPVEHRSRSNWASRNTMMFRRSRSGP